MNALATTTTSNGNGALSLWNREQLDLIKQQIAPKCTDEELKLFGIVCARTGLDPFARQIYAVKRGSGDKAKMTVQVSIDGLRLQGERSKNYGGSQTYWCGADGIWRDVWLSDEPPLAAKTEVFKANSDKPFVGVAKFSSYAQYFDVWENRQRTGEKKLAETWATMPDVMVGKCSEALALRKAFPAELSGLYLTEEMQQADNNTIDVEVVRPPAFDQIKSELDRLGYSNAWSKDRVQKTYGKSGAKELSDEELADYLSHLQSLQKPIAPPDTIDLDSNPYED